MFFTLEELKERFDSYSFSALSLALNRMVKKGKIVSFHQGFYLIIPPDRMSKKILPPTLFIDSLMQYLGRDYYLGLLSAAAVYGAQHQQAQECFVFISKPPLRTKSKNGVKINFIVKNNFPQVGIDKISTETGYVKVASPELTILDLVKYQNKIGGINRAALIIEELLEEVDAEKFKKLIEAKVFSVATLQRLGYLLEKLGLHNLADLLFLQLGDGEYFPVPLRSNLRANGYPVNKKWKVIENVKIEFNLDS